MGSTNNKLQSPIIEYLPLSQKNPQFDSQVSDWVNNDLGTLTTLQKTTIPLIKQRKSTLIIAPTGSGKTFAGFVGILDELIALANTGKLEDRVYAIYISPLKALNNDIAKNLEQPLKMISRYVGKIPIRVSVRTGDTTSSAKSKMLRHPPHILITTPESLGIALATKKFSGLLKSVEWVIVDEIHDLAANKRGTFLSLCLEWLEWNCKKPPVRIGMSATVHPIEKVGQFLMGIHDEKRKLNIVIGEEKKNIDIELVVPTQNLDTDRFEKVHNRLIDHILAQVEEVKSMILFANTRKWTEYLAASLIEASGGKLEGKVGVHHGSIDRTLRLETEERMKAGDLKIIVTSTSLELGIDIGEIDLAMLWGSPKEVSTAIQRVGRAGHSLGKISKGHLLATDMIELLENIAIKKLIEEGKIEEVQIPTHPLDVLSQIIVGLVSERSWDFTEIFKLVTSAFAYKDLKENQLYDLLESMDNPTIEDERWRYGRIWWNREEKRLGRKGNSRLNFIMNVGTIPDVTTIQVVHEITRTKIGTVSERFAERLIPRDVFILGGAAYRYLRTVGNKIIVRRTHGLRPTVPSWVGEGISRSRLVGIEIGKLLDELRAFVFEERSSITYSIYQGKDQVLSFIERQMAISEVPSHKRIISEMYVDASGIVNILVLSVFGRKVNEPIAHGIATAISRKWNVNVGISATDNGFGLILPPGLDLEVDNIFDLISDPETLVDLVRSSISKTEQFKIRFRHVAVRSLMILKRSPKFSRSPEQQFQAAQRLLKYLEPDFPLLKEVEEEIFSGVFDLRSAKGIISDIKNGGIDVISYGKVKTPSPMSHEILLASNSDVILMENRRELLLSLHKQVVSKLLEGKKSVFDREQVEGYFESKLSSTEFSTDLRRRLILFGSGKGVVIEALPSYFKSFEGSISGWLFNGRLFEPMQLAAYLVINQISNPIVEEFNNGEIKPLDQGEVQELVNSLTKEEATETLVYHLLFSKGALSKEEIANILGIGEGITQKALERLLEKGEIIGGNIFDENLRYITKQDHERLSLQYSKSKFNDDGIFRERLNRLTFVLSQNNEEITDIISQSGPIRNFLSVFQRFPQFTWGKILEGLEKENLYFGRFFSGTLVLVTSRQARAIIKIKGRQEQLNEEELLVYEIIAENPGISFNQIVDAAGFSRSKVREILRFLESLLYIGRVGEGVVSSFTQNQQFISLPDPKAIEFDKNRILRMLVKEIILWYHTLTIDEILRITRLSYQEIDKTLERLLEENEIELQISGGLTYYTLPGQLDHKGIDRVFLLPWEDPVFLLRGRYQQTWIHPRYGSLVVTYEGENVGTLDFIHLRRDFLQIISINLRDILLYDRIFLDRLAREILKVGTKYFRTIVVSIEEVNGHSLNDKEVALFTSTFEKMGFQLDRDYLISARQVSLPLRNSEIIELKLIGIRGSRRSPDPIDEFLETFGWFTIDQFSNHFQTAGTKETLTALIRSGRVSVSKGIYRVHSFDENDLERVIISLLRHNFIMSAEELVDDCSGISSASLVLGVLADLIRKGRVSYILNETQIPYYYHKSDLDVIQMKNREELFPEWWIIPDVTSRLLTLFKSHIHPLNGTNLVIIRYGQPVALAKTKSRGDTYIVENIHFSHLMKKEHAIRAFTLLEEQGFNQGYLSIFIQKVNDFSPRYWIGGNKP